MGLRPYQEQMKAEIYAAWQTHQCVLLCLPTGLGKTRVFCTIAEEALRANTPTAICVHRKELVQQISLTLSELGIRHNIIAPKSAIKGFIAAQRKLFNKQFYDYSAPVTVVSVDTLNARILKHAKWAKTIRLYIVDEAAHVLRSNKWGRAVGYFSGARGLGVTATPQRLDKRGLGKHADGIFDTMVEGPGSAWGIQEGFLSRYKIAVPRGNFREQLGEATSGHDFTREAMARASAKSTIIGDAVVNYQKFADGKQAIYFCTDIAAAKKMEEAFNVAGVRAKLLTGDTDDKIRLNTLIDFRDRKIQVLLNVDLFDEGLDVPGIEVVGMCRPTKSLGKYLQMVGRGLRILPGKEYCIIIDHVGNVNEHGLPDAKRRWTLDRIVKRRDKTNLIRICYNHQCNAPFDRALTSCPYCGFEAIANGGGGGGGRIPLKQVDGDLELLDPETLRELLAGATLEDPARVAERVAKAAGGAAGLKAQKAQMERIKTQKDLANTIALWAGKQRSYNYTDRQIHKKFYLEYGMNITFALSEPRADMLETMALVKEEIG